MVKAAVVLDAEVGASREGSLGEYKLSNAWIVSLEDGEILGSVELTAARVSAGGFLEGVTNLITEGIFFSANFSAGFSTFIDLKSFLLEEFKDLRVNEEYKPECL